LGYNIKGNKLTYWQYRCCITKW